MIGVNSALIAVSAATDTLRPVFLLIAVAPTFILWLLAEVALIREASDRM